MRERVERVANWLDSRTGIQSGVRRFMVEEIPASSGWRQVFGSVALFLILVQAFTGLLLAINYAPTPGDAYNSLRYIVTEVTGGRLIRGLHHWGASMIIVVVALHMIQVFIYGAYKKPREATWMSGVVLFLVTLAYGLTGYLLPWDNRAYWGTVVATRIASQAPIAGAYLARLLGGEGAIGAVTFARFYGLHVLLLPAATALFIGLHVSLVRRHGVAPVPGDELRPTKRFYPGQVFKDTVAIFVAFAVLFLLAALAHVPLEQMADPSDTNYIPRPEWYFLFLFQMLKLFNGPLELVGSVVLPGLAVLALVMVPFIDRGRMERVTKRVVACGLVLFAFAAWAGLTATALATTPKRDSASIDYSGPTEWLQAAPADLAGVKYFRDAKCAACHEGNAKAGPNLGQYAMQHDSTWLLEHVKHSQASPALSQMQLTALAALMGKLNPGNASVLESTPDFAAAGAVVYQARHCAVCHSVNGTGATGGLSLDGLAARRSRDWVELHFADPQKLSPGSVMPAFKLSREETRNLTSYLLTLESR